MRVEEIVTNQILDLLGKGKIPWKQSWSDNLPMNLISKREYSGINLFLLSILGYSSPYFLTFNQVQQVKGHIKKGAKGIPVVFWNTFDKEVETKGKKKIEVIPFLRYYTVFNTDQCEGIEIPKKEEAQKDENYHKYEEVLHLYKDKPLIKEEGNRACYRPKEDLVCVPPLNRFKQAEDYFSVLFHELVHSTGLDSRLDRFKREDLHIFGSESYSKEELIAELGSAFLSARYKIDNSLIEQSAGYIQGWVKVLKSDPKFIISASGKAQRAVNYMLNIKYEREEKSRS